MQKGWEEWDGLRLCYSVGNPLIPKDHINYPHMCLKWGTSPIMKRLMMIKMDILPVSTILEFVLTRILDREKQKVLARLMWRYSHNIKRGYLDFYQSQIVFMKSSLLSKNSDLITLGKYLNLVVPAHKEARLCGSYIRYKIEEKVMAAQMPNENLVILSLCLYHSNSSLYSTHDFF